MKRRLVVKTIELQQFPYKGDGLMNNHGICNDTAQLSLVLFLYLLDKNERAKLWDAFLRLPQPEESFTAQHETVPPQ
jgi:hypothetical protein